MAYTFNNANTDDITLTFLGTSSAGADNATALVTGWWYPTALTAARALWGGSQNFDLEIDSTAGELRFRTPNATTKGEWTTSGAGFTQNAWNFVACMVSTEDTGPADAVRIWTGTHETPPAEVTVNPAVTPVGTHAAGGAITIGAASQSTSVAFPGDVDRVQAYVTGASTASGLILNATNGVITQDEADNVLRRLVWPAWQGKLFNVRTGQYSSTPGYADHLVWEGGFPGFGVCKVGLSTLANLSWMSTTIAGATLSTQRCPRTRPERGLVNSLPCGRR